MSPPPIPPPSSQLLRKTIAILPSTVSGISQIPDPAKRTGQISSSFGRARKSGGQLTLYSGGRIIGSPHSQIAVILEGIEAKKRLTIIDYGAHSIRLIRIEKNRINPLLEASPELAQDEAVRSLFAGNVVAGLRFSPEQQPVRSKLGLPSESGEGHDLLE